MLLKAGIPIGTMIAVSLLVGDAVGINAPFVNNRSETQNSQPQKSEDVPTMPSQETPISTMVPTPVEAPPPSSEATPIPLQEHESPTLVPAKSEAPKIYTINFLEAQDPQNPAQANVTENQATEIIESYFAVLPPTTKIKINVVLGGGSYYYPGQYEMKIDRASPNFSLDFGYEYGHLINDQYKSDHAFQQQREALLGDPKIGSQIPDLKEMFGSNYETALVMYQSGDPLGLEEIQILSSHQGNSEWIFSNGNDPFGLPLEYARIAKISESYEIDEVQFDTASDFINSPETQKLKDNPLWAQILNKLESEENLEDYFLFANRNLYSEKSGKNYNDALKIIGRATIAGKVIENDQKVKDAIDEIIGSNPNVPDAQKENFFESVKENIETRLNRAQDEDFASKISYYIDLKMNGRLLTESTTMEELIGTLNSAQAPVAV